MAKKNKKPTFNKNLYTNTSSRSERKKGPIDKLAYVIYCISAVFFAISSMTYFNQQNSEKGFIYLVLLILAVYLIYVYRNKKD